MKNFFLIISLISIVSCKKNNNCQECKTFGTLNGIDYGIPPNQKSETWCEGSPIPIFTDASGNQLNSICR
jgi:hypothetical protein